MRWKSTENQAEPALHMLHKDESSDFADFLDSLYSTLLLTQRDIHTGQHVGAKETVVRYLLISLIRKYEYCYWTNREKFTGFFLKINHARKCTTVAAS